MPATYDWFHLTTESDKATETIQLPKPQVLTI